MNDESKGLPEWLDLKAIPDPRFQPPGIDVEHGVKEGWRAWGLPKSTEPGAVPRLYSVTYGDYFWAPRRGMKAESSCGQDDCPSAGCSCGFYSAKTFDHLQSMGYHRYDADAGNYFHVVGKVACWGRVVECTTGWRSEWCYPVALFVPFEAWRFAKPLRDAYGVPVQLKNILKTAVTAGEEAA
jgi:hypothetical protein